MRMYSLTELNKGIEFGMCGKNTTLRMVPLSCDIFLGFELWACRT